MTSTEQDVMDVEESEIKGTPKELNRSDPTKEMEDEEEDESNEEEGYDEEEEKEKSLIVEGKREKKKVERLTLLMSVKKKEEDIVEGRGVKLIDIERIQYFMKKRKSEELRVLHKLLYNRVGTLHCVKRNIAQFSGFPFEKDSDQYKKKEEIIKRFKKVMLKLICEVLDLERSGANGELIARIMNFLMEPKPSGKPLPKSAMKTPPSKGGKKDRSSTGSSKKKQPKDTEINVILSCESSSETSEEEKESEAEEEEPPKKKSKQEKPKQTSTPKTTPKGKKNVKVAHVKKADSSTAKKNQNNSKKEEVPESESESDSSDDEPLIKKVKKPPTDDELKETVKKLLANANLEEVTMKQICKKVNESYPNDDLSSKKDFIKAAVKELIS